MYCKLLNWVHSTLHRLKSMWSIPSLCGEPLPKCTEGNTCRDLCLFLLNISDHVKTILPHQTPLPQSPRKKNCLCVNDWLHHIQKCVESAGIGGCGGLTGGTSAGNQWALSPYGVRASWAHEWSQRSGVVSGCGVMDLLGVCFPFMWILLHRKTGKHCLSPWETLLQGGKMTSKEDRWHWALQPQLYICSHLSK